MKKLVKLFAAVAMIVAGSASMGCVLFLMDEPKALDSMVD